MPKNRRILPRIRLAPTLDLPAFRLRSRLGLALVSAPLLAVLSAFALVDIGLDTPPAQLQQQTLPLALQLPQAPLMRVSETWSRGDTLGRLLTRMGVDETRALAFLQRDELASQITQLPVGSLLQAEVQNGKLYSLRFNQEDGEQIEVVRTDESWISQLQLASVETRIEVRSGEITSSLFGALDRADVPDRFAQQLIDIFAGDIDFRRGVRKGDRFRLVYEVKQDSNGMELGAGRLLSAEFNNAGRQHRAVGFQRSDGELEYFTPEGESLKRAFLKNPVEFSRVSSGFTLSRMHPVLNTVRAHKGVDYAAPMGSKIMATADGSVEFVGVQNGYGNVVVLKHDNTYSTVYGHMQNFASGLKRGQKVSQGQVIGYVGMTGLASGPHLHYEFKRNGEQIDPQSAEVPLARPLPASEKQRFAQQMAQLAQQTQLLDSARQSGFE